MEDLTKQTPYEVVNRLARFTLKHKRGERVDVSDALHSTVTAVGSPPGHRVQAELLELPCSDEVTVDDALSALLLIPDERRALDRVEVALIEAAMDRGATWEQVGRFYWENSATNRYGPPKGVTKQSIQRRYRRLGGKRNWPTRRPAPKLPADRDAASEQ